MSMRTFQVAPNASVQEIAQTVSQNLSGQGYQCNIQPLSPTLAMLVVDKDREGFKNTIGLGIECRASLAVNGNQLTVSIDSEWTNKIIALVVGWFLCLIPFITGIIGCIEQSSLPDKIFTAFQMAVASANANYGGYQGQQFTQQPYQANPQYTTPDNNNNQM